MTASRAIDGVLPLIGNSGQLNEKHCAASTPSETVTAWLRIDLQKVYLINKVVVTFYGGTGRKAIIRVGSTTTNNGNDNLLCGTVENYRDANRVPTPRTVECQERLWGRYVSIHRPIRYTLMVCEVEVYNGQ